MATRKKKLVLPKTLGGCADKLFKIKTEKAELSRKVKDLEGLEKAIKERLIQELPKDKAEGVIGKLARATIKQKNVASVKNWESFYKFILKTKDFSLMQKRVSDAAVKERWEDGKKVPGVEAFNVISVSITKK
ncbi:hypothetical protein KAR91_84065 [Candidatus Pacearchaeota archaeon]|nr:hypothetical protein [Candidatus Pacearchaeota archaeon]